MVIQPLIMLLEGESSNIFYCLPSASPRAVKHPTKQTSFKPNWVQNNKKERENGQDGGRGPTMCNNILLPSKGSNA